MSASSENEENTQKKQDPTVRQDLAVVFTQERDFRNVDQVRIRISQYTGIIISIKVVTQAIMETLLAAIEADALLFQEQQMQLAKEAHFKRSKTQPIEMVGLPENDPIVQMPPSAGIINLKFKDCLIQSKAVQLLKAFLIAKQFIETFGIQNVELTDPHIDFRLLMEGVQFSVKIKKLAVQQMIFDQEFYGKILCNTMSECRQLRELDASECDFFHPKCFFDVCQALISEKSRVIVLKLKKINLQNLEGKVLQFLLMKNKSLHTLDLSNSKVESAECLEYFFQKIDKHSSIRNLILENVQPDLCAALEVLGEAISQNQKLEVLIMRENKLKWQNYCGFWENMRGNTSLLKINVSKTDLSDKILDKMTMIIQEEGVRLMDLDLSRNLITDVGLATLADALLHNSSIKYLNLSQNFIKDQPGLQPLVQYLSSPTCSLVELSLMGNRISNDGIVCLSHFVKLNTSLKMLDISKNAYSDQSFGIFASEMGQSANLTLLDISKSKELNDEGSLIILAKKIAQNKHLQTLDLGQLRVRKPFLKLYLEPALKQNITLKYVIGKFTPDIIDEQLNLNIQIQTDVEPNYTEDPKTPQAGFDVKLFDSCNSILQMRGQSNILFDAVFKFLCHKSIRQVDLTGMDIQDGQLYQLAAYLKMEQSLRSLQLNENKNLTDYGVMALAEALSKNRKLAHLSLIGCRGLTDESLKVFYRVLVDHNTMLCSLELGASETTQTQYCEGLIQKLRYETELNMAIQLHLKPSFYVNGQERPEGSDQKVDEVIFIEGAPVHEYFGAAIKCWRIVKPSGIQIENQQISDEQVLQLCEFLKDRNLVTTLNLRRNLITNQGVLHLVKWIEQHDQRLTHLDVSRNRITKAGAELFLTALQKQTRIVDFQFNYGNLIPLDIGLKIQDEILANNQIRANQTENHTNQRQFTNKVTLTRQRYELIDRGPSFMRCAIKSVELCRIRHLSLPDNMLGLAEARMLAQMIRLNPPLQTLNLQINNLDAECAKLIGAALESNSNLQILNLSQNRLADLGINYLLQPLIKSRVQGWKLSVAEMKIRQDKFLEIKEEEPSSMNLKPRKDKPKLKENVYLSSATEIQAELKSLETEVIEHCEMSQLKILNLLENKSTLESYKLFATLMHVDHQIVLLIDTPDKLLNPTRPVRTLSSPAATSKSTQSEADQHVIVNFRQRIKLGCSRRYQSAHQRLIRQCKRLCCYKLQRLQNMTTLQKPSLLLVLTWRIHQCRQSVLTFKPKINLVLNSNTRLSQSTFIALMVTTHALVQGFAAVIPYVMGAEEDSMTLGITIACFFGYLWLFEFFLLALGVVGVNPLNPYLLLQMLAGFLPKCALVSMGVIGANCLAARSTGGLVLAIVCLVLVAIDQYGTIRALWYFLSSKVDEYRVLAWIERSHQVAQLLNYKALLVVYRKVSLLPTDESKVQALAIAEQLNPDLVARPASNIIKRQLSNIKDIYIYDQAKRHLLLINLPLALIIAIGLGTQWVTFNLSVYICIGSWFLDFVCLLFIVLDRSEYSKVALDCKEIYEKGDQRRTLYYERYSEVLTRDKKTPRAANITTTFLQDGDDDGASDACSLKETENQMMGAEQGANTVHADGDKLFKQIMSPKQMGGQESLVFQTDEA